MKEQNRKSTNHLSVEEETVSRSDSAEAVPSDEIAAEESAVQADTPQKNKWYSRFRLESGELSKIIACGFAIVILYLFFRSEFDFGNLKEWLKPQTIVIYALKQLLNVIFGYLITLILRIKNEKAQFWLTFVFAFIVDNLIVFEATGFEFSVKNTILLAFIAVILTVFVLKTLFHKKILQAIDRTQDEAKRARRKKAYWIFYWVLFALTIAASVAYAVLVFTIGFKA